MGYQYYPIFVRKIKNTWITRVNFLTFRGLSAESQTLYTCISVNLLKIWKNFLKFVSGLWDVGSWKKGDKKSEATVPLKRQMDVMTHHARWQRSSHCPLPRASSSKKPYFVDVISTYHLYFSDIWKGLSHQVRFAWKWQGFNDLGHERHLMSDFLKIYILPSIFNGSSKFFFWSTLNTY